MAVTTRGLTPADIDAIRDGLASGRKPKVVFGASAGQVAGTAGQVVELTDPAASDEWIVVRFGRDELPFAPSDLVTPARAAAEKATRPAPPAKAATPAGPSGPPLAPPLARRPGRPGPNPTQPSAPTQAQIPAPTQIQAQIPKQAKATPTASVPAPEATSVDPLNGSSEPAPAARPAKAAKVKAPASLTVTLAYTDREWTVAANMGTKVLAKPYEIRPTDALRMVALIDVPGVHEAVEQIIEAERAEAEGRASRLRAELAEIESRLAELTHSD